MRNKFSITFLIFFTLGLSSLANGQVTAWFDGGPKIIISSATNPPGVNRKVIGSIQTTRERNVFSRVYVDEERAIYFGYDVVIEPDAEGKHYTLTFKPLSVSPDSRSFSTGRDYPASNSLPITTRQKLKMTAMILPKYPEPQIIEEDDTLAFDVLVNPETGVKIVDLIKIVSANSPLPQTLSVSGARRARMLPTEDFTISSVELKISSSKLLVNGQPIIREANNSHLSLSGALIWIYLPHHGRFVLSLTPRKGFNFQKVGTIQGNKISFLIGGSLYEWISASPVVTSGNQNWNLWVLRDKDYKPDIETVPEHPYLMGAADDVDFLQEKK
jgi:hypothetical protein